MDFWVSCYLEYFESLPRNSLHDRRKRRAVVEYVSTLIEGVSRGTECESQDATREAISAIIRYHDHYCSINGQVCKMGKYHNILYVALKLCFDHQLQDTPTVIKLLEAIHKCEATFERLFVGAIFGNRAPHYIAGWKSDFDSQEENLRAVVYFLHHANEGRLHFSETRFIDYPIESCGNSSAAKVLVQLGVPDKLHILLRHGALVSTETVVFLMNRLLEFRHCYPYNLVACLQFSLRSVPRVQVEADGDYFWDNYNDLVQDGVLPGNRTGFLQVPELKHLSRCVIRKQLWDNYKLPAGVKQLAIPESLQKYLDLMSD